MATVNRRNTTTPVAHTHEGGRAAVVTPFEELTRSVLACLLFEDSFYEDGETAAARITRLVHACDIRRVLELARSARLAYGLRSAPAWLINAVWSHPQRAACEPSHIVKAIDDICIRPDDMGELVAMYWMQSKRPLPASLKRGLAQAFPKFSFYQLAKYAKRGNIRLRDVLRLVHPAPKDAEQSNMWKRLANDELESADTWEVALSNGADKRDTFTRLLSDGKLGALALLRNLRNMYEARVAPDLIASELMRLAPRSKLFPFQFIAAARAVPQWETMLDEPMMAASRELNQLPGRTALLVDTSGSMRGQLSRRSTLDRLDGAKGLAIMCREMCQDVDVYTFDTQCHVIPPRHGFALGDAIGDARGGTDISGAVRTAANNHQYDRYIIFTDEQSSSGMLGAPPNGAKGYIMNVAAYQHGVGYGKWTTISGFSENVLRFIEVEEM